MVGAGHPDSVALRAQIILFADKLGVGARVQGSGSRLITGVGINLFSNDINYGGVYPERFKLDKKSWCRKIAEYILTHRYQDTDTLKTEWELRCHHMGSHVTITEGKETYSGIFKGLGTFGEALLQTVNEGERKIFNGTLRIT